MQVKSHHTLIALAVIATAITLAAHTPVTHIAPEQFYPDHSRTPGALNPAVTQATIQQTICTPGYTATIRPSASYTDLLKATQLDQEGYALRGDTNPADYEEDHFISLELGGNPTSPLNLWPQSYISTTSLNTTVGARQKDQVENLLHKEVCSGQLTLKQAQEAITRDWYALYQSGSAQYETTKDPNDQ